MRTIYLVACSGSKSAQAGPEGCPAADLYTGTLFRLQREFIRQAETATSGPSEWLILSALHGLVLPTATITPYEQTLGAAAFRRDWSARLLAAFLARFGGEEELNLVVFAGEHYREWLTPLRAARPTWQVQIPLYGLGIGEQMQAMKRLTNRNVRFQ